MRNIILKAAVGLAFIAAAATAQAGTKTLILDQDDMVFGDGAAALLGFGVIMPDAGDPDVGINFVLPKDFKKNSVAKVKVFMVVSLTGCTLDFSAVAVLRMRKGKSPSVLPAAAAQLVAASPGATAVPAAADLTFVKEFNLSSTAAGSIQGQKPGDQITVIFERNAGAVADTCGSDLLVSSFRITYKTP